MAENPIMTDFTALETEPRPGSFSDEEPYYEIINDERKELEPMGAFQSLLASILNHHLLLYLDENPRGIVGTEMLFQLRETPRLQRQPDLAYVSYERWPERTVPRSNAWNVVPDLAVEIVSPTNLAEELDQRIGDYFMSGVTQVWVIYPQTERLYVYRSLMEIHGLARLDTLDGGDFLPGFSLPLEKLFSAVTKPDSNAGSNED